MTASSQPTASDNAQTNLLLSDAHTHLVGLTAQNSDFPPYGVFHVLLCASHPDEWDQIAHWAQAFPQQLTPSFGIHPWYAADSTTEHLEKLESYLDAFPNAGVGETGLDKAHQPRQPLDSQKKLFQKHLELAHSKNRLLTLHCVRAWGSVLELLRFCPPPKLLVHGWNGPNEMVDPLLNHQAYFSFGQHQLTNPSCSIAAIPEDRILLETDGRPEELKETLYSLQRLRPDMPLKAWARRIAENYNALLNL